MKTFAISGLGMALASHMADLADLREHARSAYTLTRSAALRVRF